MPLENYFFDLDGTIINSEPGLLCAHTHALEQLGYQNGLKILAEEGLAWTIGPALGLTVPRLIGSDDPTLVQEYIQNFQDLYQEIHYKDFILYDAVPVVLQTLKKQNKKLFICTSKPELIAKKIIAYLQLNSCLCDVIGPDLDERPHQKSDLLQALCQKYQCKPAQSAMIGDRCYDMLAGKKLQFAACVGVLYGFGSENELRSNGANYIIKNLQELLTITT